MTERVDQLLASKDELDLDLVVQLDGDDLADLEGRALQVGGAQRARSLGLLSLADASPTGRFAQALGTLLLELQPEPGVLAAGVAGAAALGPAATPLVAPLVTSPEPLVSLAAWRTLQHVAGPEVLEFLRSVAPPLDDPLGRQANLAMCVIACRSAVRGFELPVPDETHIRFIPVEVTDLHSITQGAPDSGDFNLLSRVSASELHLVEPAPGLLSAVQCGGDRMLICASAALLGGPAGLMTAPALGGVVLVRDSLGTSMSARYLVLTWPDGFDGFHVGLFQPDGIQAYYGHPDGDQIADGQAVFPLFALDEPGLAVVSIEVTMSAETVSLGGEMIAMADVLTDRLEPDPAA